MEFRTKCSFSEGQFDLEQSSTLHKGVSYVTTSKLTSNSG